MMLTYTSETLRWINVLNLGLDIHRCSRNKTEIKSNNAFSLVLQCCIDNITFGSITFSTI